MCDVSPKSVVIHPDAIVMLANAAPKDRHGQPDVDTLVLLMTKYDISLKPRKFTKTYRFQGSCQQEGCYQQGGLYSHF